MTRSRQRVVIENVTPEIDGGRFPVKRTVGQTVRVEADIHTDGHDLIAAFLMYREAGSLAYSETPMIPIGNDRWSGAFRVVAMGRTVYTLQAWVARVRTWQRDLSIKMEAGQEISVDLLVGAALAENAAKRAKGADRRKLMGFARSIRPGEIRGVPECATAALNEELGALADRYPDRTLATRHGRELPVVVDPERARFGAWYELFPRSCSRAPGRHGTFKDVEERLPYVASMGFDVLYLPPIHPIGRINRKGRNNATVARPEDVGSPWAIGAAEGGHKAVHPQLGTIEEFEALVRSARDRGIGIAMDIAFQCAPDHPYVTEHPEWFRMRPDGTVQYAENPPKKYEDIIPFDFDTPRWLELWEEMKSIVLFWAAHGVRIFRIDNPHTKPFAFWEWLIAEVKREHPDAIFLAEAFTRPKVMYRLAKAGFTQSYTYFTWRNTKPEIEAYFRGLTKAEVREVFRPALWPNTPDILTEQLQYGGRPAFMARLVLAATLGATYGIYGPAFELCEHAASAPGKEEYLDSEKYEIRAWDTDRPDSLREFIAVVNRIRRESPPLQSDDNLRFHTVDNDQLIAYSKSAEDGSGTILVVVNLDPRHTQSGWVELPLEEFGLGDAAPFQGHDLLSGARFLWQGRRFYVELDPFAVPAHIIRLRRRVRTEKDFDYFM
ncbi:MAG: alpha-1,4-glucan--maltose-1-phosphate maltosyltransferase [Deltaproteobacteria bacterium CG2_30_66_27]|nr:MAG: alpha-1,4-glucan--maltose-1-phosphate maltosyltransferase [Deltaproteobacteria bacterium CG2_30_66_27]